MGEMLQGKTQKHAWRTEMCPFICLEPFPESGTDTKEAVKHIYQWNGVRREVCHLVTF